MILAQDKTIAIVSAQFVVNLQDTSSTAPQYDDDDESTRNEPQASKTQQSSTTPSSSVTRTLLSSATISSSVSSGIMADPPCDTSMPQALPAGYSNDNGADQVVLGFMGDTLLSVLGGEVSGFTTSTLAATASTIADSRAGKNGPDISDKVIKLTEDLDQTLGSLTIKELLRWTGLSHPQHIVWLCHELATTCLWHRYLSYMEKRRNKILVAYPASNPIQSPLSHQSIAQGFQAMNIRHKSIEFARALDHEPRKNLPQSLCYPSLQMPELHVA